MSDISSFIHSPQFLTSFIYAVIFLIIGMVLLTMIRPKSQVDPRISETSNRFMELMDTVIEENNLTYEYKPLVDFNINDFIHLRNMAFNSIKNSEYICENDKELCTSILCSLDTLTVKNAMLALRYIIYREEYNENTKQNN